MYEGDETRSEITTRKRPSASKRNRHKRSALCTCVTAKQMRAALELNDAIPRKERSGVSLQTMEPINGDAGNIVKMSSESEANSTSKRNTIRKSASRHRNKQPKCALDVAANNSVLKEFVAATISIGLFVVNCSRSSSYCVVRFWFATHVLTYDFCHDVGEFSYRVGYSIPFSDIVAITFGDKTIHLQLKVPAKQEYCTRLGTLHGKIISESLDEYDISQGQRDASTTHVIHLVRESTKAWKQALLKHNCDLLHRISNASEQLPAVAAFPTIPDSKTNGIQLTSIHAVVPVVITAQVHPTVMTTQHAATAAAQQVPFHKPVTLHQEGLPALSEASIFQQGSNFQNSSGSPSITPLLPMDNAPHFANHFIQALPYNGSQYVVWPATTASQTVAISDMSMYSSPVCKNAPLNASISDHEVRVDSELEDMWPHIVDSEYMPIPEPADSEYILQKIDSQYLLSELDMRPA